MSEVEGREFFLELGGVEGEGEVDFWENGLLEEGGDALEEEGDTTGVGNVGSDENGDGGHFS